MMFLLLGTLVFGVGFLVVAAHYEGKYRKLESSKEKLRLETAHAKLGRLGDERPRLGNYLMLCARALESSSQGEFDETVEVANIMKNNAIDVMVPSNWTEDDPYR